MRIRLPAVVLFLSMGAVANVLVSWSSVLLSPAEEWRFTHPDSWTGNAPSATDLDLLANGGERIKPDSVVEQRGNAAWQLRAVAIDYSDNDQWMSLDAARASFSVIATWPFVFHIKAGWPIRSFEGVGWTWRHDQASDPRNPLEHLVQVEPGGPLRLETRKLIPVSPLWLGLVVNSVVLGILMAVPVFTCRMAVGWSRVRRHKCYRCKYSLLSNESGVCPECGAVIPTSRVYSMQLPAIRIPRIPLPSLRVLLLTLALLTAVLLVLYLLSPVA